jgi:hypothetical protein
MIIVKRTVEYSYLISDPDKLVNLESLKEAFHADIVYELDINNVRLIKVESEVTRK